jgi:hypothetical protein
MEKTKDQVIELIQKLANMRIDRGATPAEAANALAKIDQLLEAYQLTMLDVERKTFNEDLAQEIVELGISRIPQCYWDLAYAVAGPRDCRVITVPKDQKERFIFNGFRSDVVVASYEFRILLKLWLEQGEISGRSLGRAGAQLIKHRNDFVSAAASAFREQLIDVRNKRQEAPASTALVVVKKAAVDKYFCEQFPSIRYSKRKQAEWDVDAYRNGRQAGKTIELKKAMKDQTKPPALESK